MKYQPDILIKKSILITFATILVAVGICLFLQSALGSDPITVWVDGLRHTLKISMGNASLLNNLVMLLLAVLLARKYIYIGTVIGALGTGPLMNFFEPLVTKVFGADPDLYRRVLMMSLGQVILCAGVGLTLSVKFGFGTTDSLIVKLCTRYHLKYKNVKILSDLAYTGAGMLLGGVFGIGSVVGVLSGGPFIAFFENHLWDPMVKHLKLNR